MPVRSIPFNSFSILFQLKSCTSFKNPTLICHLHAHIIKLGFTANVYVATALLHAYASASFDDVCRLFDDMPERNVVTWNTMITGYERSGNVEEARRVFDKMPLRDVVSWSAMIGAYVNSGHCTSGLELFRQMMDSGLKPNEMTVLPVVTGCAQMGSSALLLGKSIHCVTVKNACLMNVGVGTALLDMYAKCGSLKYALHLFNLMKERNIITWTSLICGLAQHGHSKDAFSLFKMMQQAGVRPNEITFTGILSACARLGSAGLLLGKSIHSVMMKNRSEMNVENGTALLDMYAKCGFMKYALHVFTLMKKRDVIMWNSVICGLSQNGHSKEALSQFRMMQQTGVRPNEITLTGILSACAQLGSASSLLGKSIHSVMMKNGREMNVETGTILLDMYAKCGFMRYAVHLFNLMKQRDVIMWNSLICGFAQHGHSKDALSLFERMEKTGMKPDVVTFTGILSACTLLGSDGLFLGKSIHAIMVKKGWTVKVESGTALLDMYAKCRFLKYALRLFKLMKERNVITWTSLICGLAQHGHSMDALSLFEMMEQTGVRPNEMTFTGILSACAHAGLVEEGRKYFGLIESYGLKPTIEHYGCMVDLLGKAGLLEGAYETIQSMGMEPNVVIWSSYLAACKTHKQFEMADQVIDRVLRVVKPQNYGWVYALICQLYVLNNKPHDAERVRQLMIPQKAQNSEVLVSSEPDILVCLSSSASN